MRHGALPGALRCSKRRSRSPRPAVSATRRQGARILAGGHALDRPGYFVAPTIVADIREGTRLVDEEPFGPILPVIRYNDLEDAIRKANDTRYGLGGSVSNDLRRGTLFTRTSIPFVLLCSGSRFLVLAVPRNIV